MCVVLELFMVVLCAQWSDREPLWIIPAVLLFGGLGVLTGPFLLLCFALCAFTDRAIIAHMCCVGLMSLTVLGVVVWWLL